VFPTWAIGQLELQAWRTSLFRTGGDFPLLGGVLKITLNALCQDEKIARIQP
jgi:hypothetical protein